MIGTFYHTYIIIFEIGLEISVHFVLNFSFLESFQWQKCFKAVGFSFKYLYNILRFPGYKARNTFGSKTLN